MNKFGPFSLLYVKNIIHNWTTTMYFTNKTTYEFSHKQKNYLASQQQTNKIIKNIYIIQIVKQ